ncbi:hypothetical protein [Methylocystis bryophila]|uniref:Uncharacterized protein n=1 Tax=Methylocystis bryophila TaxID=655015 RepID=A0A1W6MUI2_9HYPH|nr:hypothetical protein B1812_09395 [Methylocystis bryophila]BDV37216.1 hypothetical protein DSM21852_04690 [Methylocystis bryophila]
MPLTIALLCVAAPLAVGGLAITLHRRNPTFARQPQRVIPLIFGLLMAFGSLLLRLIGMAFGEPIVRAEKIKTSVRPLIRASGSRAARGALSSAASRELVSKRRAVAGIGAISKKWEPVFEKNPA